MELRENDSEILGQPRRNKRVVKRTEKTPCYAQLETYATRVWVDTMLREDPTTHTEDRYTWPAPV